MGVGDEIMASGHARSAFIRTGKRVEIVGKNGARRWSDLWDGLDWIVRPGETGDFTKITNGPQARPYIAYPFSRATGQRWTNWRARDHMGALHLTEAHVDFARRALAGFPPFAVLEPNVPKQSNPNKQWGRHNWQKLADVIRHAGICPVQMGPAGTAPLAGVRFVTTPTFHHGAAVLKFARHSFLPEGGLHHAAGVLGLPATVLFGGYIDPNVTGYDHHQNVFHGPACGKWEPCTHCQKIWAGLAPQAVFATMPEHTGVLSWLR